MPRLIIANIDYLVTVDPSRRIIRDGAIVIQDGRIAGVGKTAEFPSNPGDDVIDGRRIARGVRYPRSQLPAARAQLRG